LDSTEQRRTENRRFIMPNAINAEADRAHIDDPKSSGWSALKIFFLIIFIIVLCVGIGKYKFRNPCGVYVNEDGDIVDHNQLNYEGDNSSKKSNEGPYFAITNPM